MPIGNYQGRAPISLRSPRGKGECDRCGVWYALSDLRKQFDWMGARLGDTGFLVCKSCLDVPFEQNRTLILPPDPMPLVNPRPSRDAVSAASGGVVEQDGVPAPGLDTLTVDGGVGYAPLQTDGQA